jgi:CRP/FNR family cyclic AMP-dependent transcriptional regulator
MPDWSSLPGVLSTENWIAALPEVVRREIAATMVTRDLAPGELLTDAGVAPEGFYQVESGYLKLVADQADGRRILILIYRPGNCMAESTLVAERAYNHTTIALTNVRVRMVPRDDFWRLYREHPEIPEALCRKFARNMSRLLARRELTTTRRLSEMVAFVFCNL